MLLFPGSWPVLFGLLAPGILAESLSWTEARSQAAAVVAQLTASEKENITNGQIGATCSGQTGTVDRFGIPGFCLQDAGSGVRATDFVNAYPGGISVAASWNTKLAHERGLYMGAEFKRKGNHAVNGPVVGPLGRVARSGRLFEGFGSDPYLSGKIVAASVRGLQKNVISVVKHFIFNEQETYRTIGGTRPGISSNVDDQTAHELYLWPFQDAIKADAAAIMASYNRINQTYASENYVALTTYLKEQLAFPGYVVSDWGAQHSGAASAAAGLDMAMPYTVGLWAGNLQAFVNNGSITQSRFDDMATRILAAWYKVIGGPDASFPEAAIGMPADVSLPHPLVEARDPASKPTILQGAIEGHVLVKNTNNALPLDKPKLLSLFGFDVLVPPRYNPITPQSIDFNFTLGLESANVTLDNLGTFLSGSPDANTPEVAPRGVLWNGGGSGANSPSALSDSYSAIQRRARHEDTYLYWDFESLSPVVNPLSSACLVLINEVASEIVDRPGLASAGADDLVLNVAGQCNNTIVVIHNPAIRIVDAWIENENVTAVIYAHYPGQELGESLAQVLYGDHSPSGRLPYTVGKNASDYGPLEGPSREGDIATDPQSNFTEGIYIDYRYFQQNSITPRFAFGFGLTYSDFEYSDFEVSWKHSSSHLSTAPPKPDTIIPGGIKSLFDVVATAKITIENTGSVVAAEVPQLYVHFPSEASQVHFLRGFDKVWLHPGSSREVTFELTRRDLSRWNVVSQTWELASGTLELRVGKSADDIVCTGTLER